MADVEIADAEIVPEPDEPGAALEVQSHGALVSGRVVTGATADEVIAHATEIANSLDRLVKAQGFAVAMGGRKPHLEIGAWQALGALTGALGGEALHAETIPGSVKPVGEKTTYHVHEKKYSGPKGNRVLEKEIDYDVEGQDWEATVEVKTAGGVVIGRAAGMCSRAESSWMPKPDPALRSMAETRAASRAFRAALGWIVAIAGYNPTPAEEMPTGGATSTGPPYGKPAEDAQVASARNAIAYLADTEPDSNFVGLLLNQIEQAAGGYMPHFPLAQIARVARAVRNRRDATPGEGDPAVETTEEREEREHAERIAADAEAEQ